MLEDIKTLGILLCLMAFLLSILVIINVIIGPKTAWFVVTALVFTFIYMAWHWLF